MKVNLLEETKKVLAENGVSYLDILWVGNKSCWFTWEQFDNLARAMNYDNGFGGAEVSEDLIVVGKDFWLIRGEYDGSEWWEFLKYPERPENHIDPESLEQDYDRTNFKL